MYYKHSEKECVIKFVCFWERERNKLRWMFSYLISTSRWHSHVMNKYHTVLINYCARTHAPTHPRTRMHARLHSFTHVMMNISNCRTSTGGRTATTWSVNTASGAWSGIAWCPCLHHVVAAIVRFLRLAEPAIITVFMTSLPFSSVNLFQAFQWAHRYDLMTNNKLSIIGWAFRDFSFHSSRHSFFSLSHLLCFISVWLVD